jgi:hypothetical protein
MNCSHGMRGEDCCQTAPSVHAPFVQPASMHTVGFTPLVLAVQPAFVDISSFDHEDGPAALRFHGPPRIFNLPASLQLRI